MPDDENMSVFGGQNLTCTATEVPVAGTDNHIGIEASSGVWNTVADTSFIRNLSSGQDQDLICSADHVVQVQSNQINNIQQSQRTTAQREITITSAENQIHVKAATEIILEVGASKIVMTADGRIEISGVNIAITGDIILSQASTQNTIIGGMVDINP